MTLSPVVQQDITGCAVASAAVLAGVSYEQSKQSAVALGIQIEDASLWSDTVHMRRLLAELAVRVADDEIAFTSWDALPNRAILAIKWHLEKGVPHWHWVVFEREGGASFVLDPRQALKMNRRTDFGRIKPKWFIEVLGKGVDAEDGEGEGE